MEEKAINAIEDLKIVFGEDDRIEPDKQVTKRKGGLYLIITFFTCIFILLFTFIDFCIRISDDNGNIIIAALSMKNFDVTNSDLTLSEYTARNVLGIDSISLIKIPVSNAPETVNKDKTENKNDTDQKDVIGIETDKETETKMTETIPEETANDLQSYPIIEMDLSQKQLGDYYIGNETGYSPDIKKLLDSNNELPVFADNTVKNEPLVLIIHTHGTESYTESGKTHYTDDGGELARTTDTTKNIVWIGKIMSDILNSKGIKTIHCDIMHDKESYQESYTRAAETIKKYIAKYPTIKYVLDVHRDAIIKSDGSLVKTVTEINGEKVAQVMTVVGSNYKGADFPDWENHLALALELKSKLDKNYPSLSRPVYLRGAAYNQQYTHGSLLLEIGSSGNTLEEAVRAAEILAETFADLINNR